MSDEKAVAKSIARWWSLYERGVLSVLEGANQIVELALEPGVFDQIDKLPHDVLERLRELAAHAPAHPEDFATGGMQSYHHTVTEEDIESMGRRGRAEGYWQYRLLREHFFPGLPMPLFEPMLSIGVVSDAAVVDQSVVVFGVHDFFIRKHPVHLVQPSGERIVTSVVRSQTVLRPEDERDDLPAREALLHRIQHSRWGLFLDSRVQSPSQVLPGTEVWVDRSDAGEIPTLADVRSRAGGGRT